MKKYYFLVLTTAIVTSLTLLLSLVRVALPIAPEYTFFTIQKGYEIFDLRLHLKKYSSLKNAVKNQKKRIQNKYKIEKDSSIKKEIFVQTQKYLFNTITDEILPYWVNTRWDYNGTTENPRQGTIACGYFISTVLMHAGIDVDRYAIGQDPAGTVIQKLCKKENIQIVKKNNFKRLFEYLKKQKDGIYILGMDWHIGFLIKKKDKIRFIHSRKPRNAGVLDEDAEDSPTLKLSEFYMVGNLLENEKLVKNWLENKPSS